MGQLSSFTAEINTNVIKLCSKHIDQMRVEIDKGSQAKHKLMACQMIAGIGHKINVTSYVQKTESKQNTSVQHGYDCKSA